MKYNSAALVAGLLDIAEMLKALNRKVNLGKTRFSRELGVSIDGHNQILLASMFKIRRFLEERQ